MTASNTDRGVSCLIPTTLVAAGLVGGFAVSRATHNRMLGGVIFAASGAAAFFGWNKSVGPGAASALAATYVAALGVSHPLARKLGAWPAVWLVTGAAALASMIVSRTRR